jgi:hypothetical protein
MGKTTSGSHDEEPIKEKIIDPEEEKRKEAEKLLQQRFKTFDVHFKDICSLLDAWDRTQGNIFRQPSPSDKSELEDHLTARKNRNATKSNTPRHRLPKIQFLSALISFIIV